MHTVNGNITHYIRSLMDNEKKKKSRQQRQENISDILTAVSSFPRDTRGKWVMALETKLQFFKTAKEEYGLIHEFHEEMLHM